MILSSTECLAWTVGPQRKSQRKSLSPLLTASTYQWHDNPCWHRAEPILSSVCPFRIPPWPVAQTVTSQENRIHPLGHNSLSPQFPIPSALTLPRKGAFSSFFVKVSSHQHLHKPDTGDRAARARLHRRLTRSIPSTLLRKRQRSYLPTAAFVGVCGHRHRHQ